MGYTFNFHDSIAYKKWLDKPQNRFIVELETMLMLDMLNPMRGNSVLDIGCGTGICLAAFIESGLQTTGIDPSPYMLDIALENISNRADLHRGFAENLPFDDNSFNYACLNTTLEFTNDPYKAIEEACRVAKDKIFLGFLNRFALNGLMHRIKGMFTETIYNNARFFSIWELKRIIHEILGDIPVSWKTVFHFPAVPVKIVRKVEESNLIRKSPFGTYVGIVVTLVPRYRTKPLPITYRQKRTTSVTAG